MKITEIIKNNTQFSFSFEVTPDVSIEDLESLEVEPAFYSITWHAKSHLCKDLEIPPLKTARWLRKRSKHVLMHLSCDLMRQKYLDELLLMFQSIGICNLFVILGENFDSTSSDYQTSKDMISYIRNTTGDYFCIGVAGFPGSKERIIALKEKIGVGANFILTQAFFQENDFIHFQNQCKANEIQVPIIPGIFLFEKWTQLQSFCHLTKVKITEQFLNLVKNLHSASENPGTEIIKDLVEKIKYDRTIHFHFFTLNKMDKVAKFIKRIYIPKQLDIRISEFKFAVCIINVRMLSGFFTKLKTLFAMKLAGREDLGWGYIIWRKIFSYCRPIFQEVITLVKISDK